MTSTVNLRKRLGVVVCDYRRPQNMKQVVAGIRGQTIPSDIIVIHQGNERHNIGCFNIHFQSNVKTRIRHLLAPILDYSYLAWVDDDIRITQPTLLEFMMQEASFPGVGVVGTNGNVLNHAKPFECYTTSHGYDAPKETMPVDTVCGIVHVVQRERLLQVYDFSYPETVIGTNCDMFLSWCFKRRGYSNRVIGVPEKAFEYLDKTGGEEFKPDHYADRNRLAHLWFG